MRSSCSVYVDAGYLLASAATRLSGSSLRSSITPNYDTLLAALIADAERRSGLPVLRVHWYDASVNSRPDAVQDRIALLPKVKLRLGRLGVDGQQKGVDVRIGLDLVAHARNNTSDIFYLVSGDDDLTEAVEDAQVHGTRIVVLAVPNGVGQPHAVSRHLLRAADELALLPASVIDDHVIKVEKPAEAEPAPIPAPPAVAMPPTSSKPAAPTPLTVVGAAASRRAAGSVLAPAPMRAYSSATGGATTIAPGYRLADPDEFDEQIDSVVRGVFTAYSLSNTEATVAVLRRDKPSIPSEVDRALLVDLSHQLGVYVIPEPVRFRLRQRFWEHVGAH